MELKQYIVTSNATVDPSNLGAPTSVVVKNRNGEATTYSPDIKKDVKFLLSAGLEYNQYKAIRQQVLKEVSDAIGVLAKSEEFGYWKGVVDCQRIVRDMMEGGE